MTSPVSSRSGFGNVNTTRNIRAVQLLLGHNKLESTVRYLGIEVDDAWRSQNRGVTLHMDATAALCRRSLSDPNRTSLLLRRVCGYSWSCLHDIAYQTR